MLFLIKNIKKQKNITTKTWSRWRESSAQRYGIKEVLASEEENNEVHKNNKVNEVYVAKKCNEVDKVKEYAMKND